MPRTNRVTPFGEIVAVPERGTMMGNRGILHDPEGHVRRPWQVRRWLLCVLEFRGRHRTVMSPNRYTELFFLDEATGLAAGHRPCAECRHARFVAFRDAWAAGNRRVVGPGPIGADAMDGRLHAERVGPGRSKGTHRAHIDDLPDGAFVTLDDADAFLIRGDAAPSVVAGGISGTSAQAEGRVRDSPDAGIDVACDPVGLCAGIHPSAGRP